MKLRVVIGDLDPTELGDLDWSGGAEHIHAVGAALQASFNGEVVVLRAGLANGRSVGLVAVDFRDDPDAGLIWMLAVHERFQSLGLGSRLIRAAERRIASAGRDLSRLKVEHDNPGARALYLRLGYRERGAVLDSWPVAGGRTYVTACVLMERRLGEVPGSRPGAR
jgi:ribosomal protein S18 acetylase RimI-like enzyme